MNTQTIGKRIRDILFGVLSFFLALCLFLDAVCALASMTVLNEESWMEQMTVSGYYSEKEQEILNGEKPQSFYAYYPNQYHNGENWLQLMIIFPLDGYWNEESGVINDEAQPKTPDRDSDQDKEYDGYYATDDYEHLRIFTTATPEPDSAAAEYDEFFK